MKPFVLVIIAVSALVVPGAASARYFMDRSEATHYIRDYLHYNRGYPHTQAYCEPYYEGGKYDRRYDYHTWRCYWRGLDNDYGGMCRGISRVKGSHSPGGYYVLTEYKRGDCL